MMTCGGCGREMRAGNLARHRRGACRVWDPGGGANPRMGSTVHWMDGILSSQCTLIYYDNYMMYSEMYLQYYILFQEKLFLPCFYYI